jgi:hypothetical protein
MIRDVRHMTAYEGVCHCGAIAYRYRTLLAPHEWNIRACQCRFCRAHGALTTSDTAGALEFQERISGTLQRYRFGQKTADFLICRVCGVYLGALIAAEDGRYGIINVNALHPRPEDLPAAAAANYDAETAEARIARRTRRWTPLSSDM